MKCSYGSLKRQVKKKIWSQNLVMIFFLMINDWSTDNYFKTILIIDHS